MAVGVTDNRRKIFVPGETLDTHVILTDKGNNSVIAITHNDAVIVVFISRKNAPSARVMSEKQAHKFAKELLDAHQAISDDAKIAQMEREFNDGE